MLLNTGLFTVPVHTGVKCIQGLSETLNSLSSFTSFLTSFLTWQKLFTRLVWNLACVWIDVYIGHVAILSYGLFFFFFFSLKHGCGCFNIAEMSHPHRGAFNWDSSWDWLFLLCLTGVCAGSVRAPCSAAVCYCVSSSAVALALTICFFSGKFFFFHCWLFRTDYQVTIVTI